MEPLDIQALLKGDQLAWDQAYPWLWATALAVAKCKLQVAPELIDDAEDVAIESMLALVGRMKKCPWAKATDRIKALITLIAQGKAIDHIRRHRAAKRGSGEFESFDAAGENGMMTGAKDGTENSPVEEEIASLERTKTLNYLQQHLKPRDRELLDDYFMSDMTQVEISEKHRIPRGSVGVFLNRGLARIRQVLNSHPGLEGELRGLVQLPLFFLSALP